MNGLDYSTLLRATLPECVVALTALIVLLFDITAGKGRSRDARMISLQWIFIGGIGLAIVAGVIWPFTGRTFGGQWVSGPMSLLVKQIILVLALLSVCLVADGDWLDHGGEFFCVLGLGVVGMLCMVSADHLLMIFVALELASLSLYVLTAFNRGDRLSVEAGLKYFLFGGMAAAFLLYGFSLLYGVTGEMTVSGIGSKLGNGSKEPLVWIALVMVIVGFGFKVAVVPFHWWAPDAYEGAPAPVAAVIASGSKVASFFLLLKVLGGSFASARGDGAWNLMQPGWQPVVAVIAALSMVLGNLAALGQTSVRRLLAYSAVAHGGYMLLGVLAGGSKGFGSVVLYGAVYGLSTVGAFGIVSLVEQEKGHDRFEAFAGFSRRSPAMAFCLMILFLSLAGIPPLGGFFGKFYLFVALAGVKPLGWMWLVGVAIGMSCVSLYYYLLVLKQAYVLPGNEETPGARRDFSLLARVAICLIAAAVILLGFAPALMTERILAAWANGLF